MAQLLGVTTKTLRHYHKIGLLQEPERTPAGYRLYSAQDLLRLQQIRQLQSFGLPLKLIKTMLGEPTEKHSWREILVALDQELATQMSELMQRRTRIQELLAQDTPLQLEQPDTRATVNWMKDLLGEYTDKLSPEALQLEAKIWAAIQNFQWPNGFTPGIEGMATQWLQQAPVLEALMRFAERIAALKAVPITDPEITRLADECAQDQEFIAFMQYLAPLIQQNPGLDAPFLAIFSDLMDTTLAPAQQRFFTELYARLPINSGQIE
ncbi:MerR family transcriptional regulator [Dictyobacter vulcani]|uniref:MerR family transcriptional regulator n=1 Tax=Dictyobacter vulcani TaxID=2607529 RepID=UPI001386B78E|nr:MerR family transcriptional regulator [Dictyobacter vulcani]